MHRSLTRHGVQVALQRGKPQQLVVDFFGVSVRTVRRIAREGAAMKADDGELVRKRGIGRPSATEGWRCIASIVTRQPSTRSISKMAGTAAISMDLVAVLTCPDHIPASVANAFTI